MCVSGFHRLQYSGKARNDAVELAQSCLDVGVEITEQGLDRRINAGSQAFLEEMWTLSQEHFRQTEPLAIKLLNQFSGVYLVDSSQISLPAQQHE